jgi:hypothetical protein
MKSMRHPSGLNRCNGAASALALGLAAFLAQAAPASADEDQARVILASMTEYLGAQQSLSFDLDATIEVVIANGSKVAIASSGSVAMERPDRIRLRRHGGFATVAMTFDGEVLSVANLDANVYGRSNVPGTVDDLIDTLREVYGLPLPAADLLASDAGAVLLTDVTEVRDLGSGVIRGEECDHLAFRSAEVDWQIWIAQGDVPHPCRFVITSRDVDGWPQYTLDFSAWGAGALEPVFAFEAPAGAREVEVKDVPDLDEVGGIFVMNEEN